VNASLKAQNTIRTRIADAQERLNVIYKLQKKHGVSGVPELLQIQRDLEQQTAGYTNLDSEIAKLEQAIVKQEKSLRTTATNPQPTPTRCAAQI
jgi:DNA repair protein RecN (Recombination protein N)